MNVSFTLSSAHFCSSLKTPQLHHIRKLLSKSETHSSTEYVICFITWLYLIHSKPTWKQPWEHNQDHSASLRWKKIHRQIFQHTQDSVTLFSPAMRTHYQWLEPWVTCLQRLWWGFSFSCSYLLPYSYWHSCCYCYCHCCCCCWEKIRFRKTKIENQKFTCCYYCCCCSQQK